MKLPWKPIVSVGTVFLFWEAASRFEAVSSRLFPPPSAVVIAIVKIKLSGELWANASVSLCRAAVGFFLGCTVGIVIGLLTGRIKSLDAFVSPLIQLVRPLPPVAIIPLVIVWLGIGELAKIWSIAFAVFFPVCAGAHQGARTVPATYLWAAKSLGLDKIRTFLRVILPSSLPTIVTGIRAGISMTFVTVFVSELAGASSGIGYAINTYQLAYRTDFMMAYIVVLAAIGAACDQIVTRTIRWIFPWLRLIES